MLLQCVEQSTAVDMWSAGVMLLSILSARFPFFQSNSDGEALAELAVLLGEEPLQRVAAYASARELSTHN